MSEVRVRIVDGRTVPSVELPDDEVLAEVLHTGWACGPLRLVAGARDRRGFMIESAVGVTFQIEAPEEFTSDDPDQVRLFYLDEEPVIPAHRYVAWVRRVALAATAPDVIRGVPDGEAVRAIALDLDH
ncbi:MAG: hypothetical protein AAFZ07_23770 [Actinomycetota bacterium]